MRHTSDTRQRNVEFRSLTKFFFIVTEDSDNAPSYLQWLITKKLYIHTRYFKISPCEKHSSAPSALIKQAVQSIKAQPFNPNIDEIWFVIDHDRWPNLERVLSPIANKPNIYIADSKPCFEIWFLMHTTTGQAHVPSCTDTAACLERTYEIYGFKKTACCDNFVAAGFDSFEPALRYAQKIDTIPNSRVLQEIGSRIYKLLINIQACSKD